MNTKKHEEPKCYLEDLTCHCNCFEGTEKECEAEKKELVEVYGHNPDRYVVRYTRFD